MHGQPYDTEKAKRDIVDGLDAIAKFVPGTNREKMIDDKDAPIGILNPYTGSEQELDTGAVLEHFRTQTAADEYSVLVVGGSVASLFGCRASDDLEKLLQKDPRLAGRTVRVLDYAHPTYKEPQQLMRVAYLLSLGYRPDAVINIDGFNEMALAYENATAGTNPAYPSFPVWGRLLQGFSVVDPESFDLTMEMWRLRKLAHDWIDWALRWRIYESSIAFRIVRSHVRGITNERFLVHTKLNEHIAHMAETMEARKQEQGPEFDRDPQRVFEQCARTWLESSISLSALCRSRGIAYLHVLQPTLHDSGSKPLSEEEKAIPPGPPAWRPAIESGYPMLRERAKELEQRGIAFLDASQAFADVRTTLYFDTCHFVPEGDHILAAIIAPYFLEHTLPRATTESAQTSVPRSDQEAR
jgi:hypothetical protein